MMMTTNRKMRSLTSSLFFLVILPMLTLWAVMTPAELPVTYNNPYAAYHERSGGQ